MTQRFYHLVFENLPCPEGARFVELEDDTGRSMGGYEWRRRDDGYYELLLPRGDADFDELEEAVRTAQDYLPSYATNELVSAVRNLKTVIHHIDGDPYNNDPSNLQRVKL